MICHEAHVLSTATVRSFEEDLLKTEEDEEEEEEEETEKKKK